MERYKEIDFDVLETLQRSPEKSAYFESIAQLTYDPVKLHKSIKKLIARNFVTERNDTKGAYFFLAETNTPMQVRRVKCPICGTVRRTHRDDQHAIHCLNPACKTACGRHRTFWLVNIDHLRKGLVRKINHLN